MPPRWLWITVLVWLAAGLTFMVVVKLILH
jgi:hypothetical protein